MANGSLDMVDVAEISGTGAVFLSSVAPQSCTTASMGVFGGTVDAADVVLANAVSLPEGLSMTTLTPGTNALSLRFCNSTGSPVSGSVSVSFTVFDDGFE